MINRIEDNMVKVDEAAEMGRVKLPEAVKHQRAARKVYNQQIISSLHL